MVFFSQNVDLLQTIVFRESMWIFISFVIYIEILIWFVFGFALEEKNEKVLVFSRVYEIWCYVCCKVLLSCKKNNIFMYTHVTKLP